MSNFYLSADKNFVDYAKFTIPNVQGNWRGPKPESFEPQQYAVAIGAGQTFGRFVADPFPAQLTRSLDFPIVNLGVGGVGPTFYESKDLIGFINKAKFCIVQVMSGRSVPNDYFDSRTGQNLFGLEKGSMGPAAFAQHVVEHVLAMKDEALARNLLHAMRHSWIYENYWLSRRIKVPKVLLWFSERDMNYDVGFNNVNNMSGQFPQFIDLATYRAVKPYFQHSVEVVSGRGNPFQIIKDGNVVPIDMGGGRMVKENKYYPSPAMHQDAAFALEGVCAALIKDGAAPRMTSLVARRRIERPIYDIDAIKPNFLVIGAAKSGTSALVNQLRSHPSVYVPEAKELHFFNRQARLNPPKDYPEWQDYLAFFEGAADFPWRGEATVAYTMAPLVKDVPEKILAHLGKIPLIYIVRDPIERVISQYRHFKRDNPNAPDIDEWLEQGENWTASVFRSNYLRQIEPYAKLFGSENIKVLFYDDFKARRIEVLAEICHFLGIDEAGIKDAPNRVVNKTSEATVPKPILSDESRAKIVADLKPDISEFLTQYGKPADFWPSMV